MKIEKIWMVRDPSDISEMVDILYETDVHELARIIMGTGLHTWESEHTTLYTEAGEAKRDAEARMKKLHGKSHTAANVAKGVPTSRGFNPCSTEAKTEYGPPPEVPPAPDGPSIGDQLRAKYKDHVPSPTVIPHIVTR
jgi:hypothetical protein